VLQRNLPLLAKRKICQHCWSVDVSTCVGGHRHRLLHSSAAVYRPAPDIISTVHRRPVGGHRHMSMTADSSSFWFTSASTEWRRRIWQMSFSSRRNLPQDAALFGIVIVHSPYTVVDCRRPSVSGRCCPCLEQSAASCHLRSNAVTAWTVTFLSSPSRDFYSCSAWAVTLSFQTL